MLKFMGQQSRTQLSNKMWLRIHPPKQETRVQSLGQEDPLKKEMATYSIILARDIPWTEEVGRLQFTGSQRVGHDWVTNSTATAGNWKEAQMSVNSRIHPSVVVFPACGILHSPENELPPTT